MSTNESAARTAVTRAENPFGNAPIVAAPGVGASAAAIIQREAQDVQVSMIVARNFPRDVIRATDRIINAFSRPGLCEDALYAYSRGGSEISGLSIRAAEVLSQNWGNIRTGVEELTRASGQSEFRVYAQDLETGFMDEKRFFVRHWRDTKGGGYAVTDERDIYEIGANQGARRKRACILAVIPKDVQDAAERQIDITLKTKADVTPDAIKALLEAFGKYNVTKEMIEKRIQRHLDAMLPAQLVQMRRIFASLKDGMSTAAEWFEMVETQPTEDPKPKSQTEAAKEALKGKKQSGKAAEKSDEDKIPNWDKDTAITAIRNTGALKQLSEVYERIVLDFTDTNRTVPPEVETAFADWKSHLESKES